MAGIPAVNSVDSVYMCLDRVFCYSELLGLQRKMGKDQFEVVPMSYYPNEKISLSCPSPLDSSNTTPYPLVMKVGTGHEGRGKVRIFDKGSFKDITGILALDKQYYTTEPFIDFVYEYRVQKIGNHYRAFKRFSRDSWKQEGDMYYESMEVTDQFKMWADECSNLFGGLDMLGIDVLHTEDGRDIIIEVNDCGTGLVYEYQDEDLQHIKELVLNKMNEVFCGQNE
eukprot:TRINITY_DN7875_c0_g1_i2.p1 TRINITY_DN7875_c0_g1~~TRINITY_DN7875_c0_g1_i2.p1  ORF type:complete len:225 (-),score=51.25 TRINITY_DN7875_c0_g1_i2:22-696(-)